MKIIFSIIILFFLPSLLLRAQQDSLLKISDLNELSLEDLMNIEVVTASKTIQKIGEAPSTVMVITAEQIKERGYEQVEDVLRDIPGVDLIHAYGQGPTFITFRGMYGDENRRLLFMIDGIVENNIIGNYEMAGPAYALQNVERVEIIWGPGSALYGANAYSAVINIITKKGDRMNGFQYQKGFGAFNTMVDNLMFGVKRSDVDVALSGSLFSTDGPRFANKHSRYSNSYVKNAWSFNGMVSHSLKKIKTTIGLRAYQTPSGLGELTQSPTVLLKLPSQGNENTGKGGVLPTDFNGEKPSLIERFARTVFLQSEFSPNSKLAFFVRAQYRETGVTERSYIYSNSPGRNFVNKSIFAYDANRIGGEVSASYAIAERHQISIGVQVSQDNLERGLRGVIPDPKFDTIENIPVTNLHAQFDRRTYTIQNNIGSYLQYVWNSTFLNKTNFTLGGRYDNNSVYGRTINPRVGVINQPYERLTFKLLYGSAFRAPTNFELYTVSTMRVANPDLKPEIINTYEANIIYKPAKFLLVQANLFQNELTDIIVQDVNIEGGKTQNQNVGNASIRGLEAKLDIIASKSFSAFMNFTYQEGTQSNGTIVYAIPNVAKVKGNIGFTAQVGKLFNINVIENWVGERSVVVTNPLGKVNEYFITNVVMATNKLFYERVSISLNIRNLFNQKYYDPGVRAADGQFYPTVCDQPGINALLKVCVTL